MLSAQFIRENEQRVRADVARRGADAPVDDILDLDARRRERIKHVEDMRAERNTVSKQIGQTRDEAERNERITAMRALGERLESAEAELRDIEHSLRDALNEVPNVLDPSVPDGADDSENIVLETVGEPTQFNFEPRPHWDLAAILDGIDFERGVKMAGSRFFVMKDGIARLHRALIQWMLDQHTAAGFEECYLPYMLSEESLTAWGSSPSSGITSIVTLKRTTTSSPPPKSPS